MIELIKAIFQPEVLVFLIPISAILGSFYYKIQKLKLQGGIADPKNALNAEELHRLRETLDQNRLLHERVQNLETIITSLDKETTFNKLDDATYVKEIINKLEK
jgi:division protein CdvB (Snf7/Vps24/ESCRT-III family)